MEAFLLGTMDSFPGHCALARAPFPLLPDGLGLFSLSRDLSETWQRPRNPMGREREFFQEWSSLLGQPFELRVPCVQTSRVLSSTILPTLCFLQPSVEEHRASEVERTFENSSDPLILEVLKRGREWADLLRITRHIGG